MSIGAALLAFTWFGSYICESTSLSASKKVSEANISVNKLTRHKVKVEGLNMNDAWMDKKLDFVDNFFKCWGSQLLVSPVKTDI
jgi:hypothetical protein